MKQAICALLVLPILYGFTTGWTDIINWGFNGIIRAKEWVSPDGRMNLQSATINMSTAIDLWPTSNVKPGEHSLSELTVHRCRWSDDCMERLNISAMVDSASEDGAYRVGIERGGTGRFRPLIFCFEDVTPGVPVCPMKIDLTGVMVLVNGEYRHLVTQ